MFEKMYETLWFLLVVDIFVFVAFVILLITEISTDDITKWFLVTAASLGFFIVITFVLTFILDIWI